MAFMYASLGTVKQSKTRQKDKFQSNLGSSSHLRLDARFSQINQIQEAKKYFSKGLKQGTHIGFYATRKAWLEDKPSLVIEVEEVELNQTKPMRNFDYAVVGEVKRYKDGTESFISLLDSNNFFRLNFNHSREEQISKALRWSKLFLELSDFEKSSEVLHVGFYCDRRLYFVAELNQDKTKPN